MCELIFTDLQKKHDFKDEGLEKISVAILCVQKVYHEANHRKASENTPG